MRNVRRHEPLGRPVFLTVVCRDRQPHLADPITKDLVVDCLRVLGEDRALRIHAWVVLHNHLHVLCTADRMEISAAIRQLKQAVLRRLRVRSIWQERFYDHIIRGPSDLRAHLDYIHFNPCKHGHVRAPIDWPWSSFQGFVARGHYDLAWGQSEPASLLRSTGSE